MPDLIRLVHGNPVGVKKLIREFRMYWKLKTSGDTAKTSAPSDKNESVTDDQPKSQEDESESPLNVPNDTSMEVDGNAEAPNTPPNDKADSEKTENQHDFAISKTQLEAKIKEIAIRDKRNDDKVPSWYVKDNVLKEYGQENLKLPNSWEYIEIKAPTWASTNKATPKIEDAGTNKPAATSGRATPTIPSITQFTQAMSPAQIQAKQALASPSTSKPVVKMDPKPVDQIMDSEMTESKKENQAEEKPALPKDQNTIMSFFKRATSSPKLVSGKINSDGAKENNKPENKTEIIMSDVWDKNMESGDKTSVSDPLEIKQNALMSQNDCLKVVKQIKRNCTVLLGKLDQPSEKVTKVTPGSRTNKNEETTANKKEKAVKNGVENGMENKSDNVEPMDTDVIVLDWMWYKNGLVMSVMYTWWLQDGSLRLLP